MAPEGGQASGQGGRHKKCDQTEYSLALFAPMPTLVSSAYDGARLVCGHTFYVARLGVKSKLALDSTSRRSLESLVVRLFNKSTTMIPASSPRAPPASH